MNSNYTMEVSERIADLVELEIAQIWTDIDTVGKSSADKWKAKLEQISREYLLSSRFALMRLLHSRVFSACQANKTSSQGANTQEGFWADETSFRTLVSQEWVTFSEITLDHARNLSQQEHLQYIHYLLELAGPSPEQDPTLHQRLILHCWNHEETANLVEISLLPPDIKADSRLLRKETSRIEKENRKQFKSLISREEALQLGHILKFTVEQMQWFLMRVFDTEDSLRMNRADDLIDAYGFLTDAPCLQVLRWKAEYREKAVGIAKIGDEDRNQKWTQKVSSELQENVALWKRYPETMDAQFMGWLLSRTSGLDLPSHTAQRIYQNLASYAYGLSIGKKMVPEEALLQDQLMQIAKAEDKTTDARIYLCENGSIAPEKCQAVAEELYKLNKDIADAASKDRTQAWSVITTTHSGELSSSYGPINSSRDRICQLFLGQAQVEKGDLLYLIWFILNIVWEDHPDADPNTLYNRIFDLKDISEFILDLAMLPKFYPPHLMENSMLLSIIYGGKTETDPAVVYDTLLQSVKKSRAKKVKTEA